MCNNTKFDLLSLIMIRKIKRKIFFIFAFIQHPTCYLKMLNLNALNVYIIRELFVFIIFDMKNILI